MFLGYQRGLALLRLPKGKGRKADDPWRAWLGPRSDRMIRGVEVPERQHRTVAINIEEVSAAPWFIRLLLRPGSPTEGLLPASRTVRAASAKQGTEDEEPEMITEEGLQ